jgi:hypothetical protein
MKKYKVHYLMCEKGSGGFTTGISRQGIFSQDEIISGEHKKLIEGIKIIKGCYWCHSLDEIK